MAICQTKVVHAQAVADNVTHLKLAVPEGCQWVTGQFARIAMPSTNEPQWRCYSIASKAGADTLDFFIARVKGSAVSPRLCNLKVGETILLDTEMNGMLIESRLQPGGRDLWLLSTGTGVAPFVAIVSDDSIMDKYERVFLVHGVRNWNETQYLQHVLKLQPKLRVMASVTRDEGAVIDVRIPDALESGLLEATAEAKLTPQASRVMLCGNPAMVKAVRASMRARGIVSPRNGEPGQLLAENFWL